MCAIVECFAPYDVHIFDYHMIGIVSSVPVVVKIYDVKNKRFSTGLHLLDCGLCWRAGKTLDFIWRVCYNTIIELGAMLQSEVDAG